MFERRLRLFLLCIFLGAFLLAARAAQVQVVQRDEWVSRAVDDAERPTFIPARRGDLLDFKGRIIATDAPTFEASVNFRVIGKEPDAKWLRDEALRRAKKMANWSTADDDQRLLLVAQEQQGVRNDLHEMWALLATVGGKKEVEIDAERDEILFEVKQKHDAYVGRLYGAATQAFSEAPSAPWYQRIIAGTPREPDLASFDKKVVNDELTFHVILPDLSQEQYNQLALSQEKLPQFKPEGGTTTCVLRLGPAVKRQYPFDDVACHVIGHVGTVSAEDRDADPNKDDELKRYSLTDRIGREGLEKLAEDQLRGSRGTKFSDRRGTHVRAEEADSGQDVKTTIDIVLQKKIQDAFKAVSFQTPDDDPNHPGAGHKIIDKLSMNGAAVVIDIKTGQVRALVSVPTFDLNQFDALYPKLVDDELNRPMTNRALLDAMEPGSTVKPIVGLAAVTQKLITVNDTVECTGYPIIDGKRISKPRCWTMSMFGARGLGAHHQMPSGAEHPTGFLNLTDAIERSCNVFFITQGDKLGLDGLSFWMNQFGLGRPTGIGLPEAHGLTPLMAKIDPADRESSKWYASIGQGPVNATPIQIANEMATIAREGIWERPTLLIDPPVKATTAPADPDAIPDRYDLHLDPTALAAVHEGMKRVVASPAGTGKQVLRKDVDLAVKTGSATATQLIRFLKNPDGSPLLDPETKRQRYELVPYGSHQTPNPELPWYRLTGFEDNGRAKGTHSWVAGYAPADHPQIAFAVYVEYGGSGGFGAGSVVTKLIDACIEEGYVTKKAIAAPTAIPLHVERPAEEGHTETH